ncbi:hypothetical protein Ciccas_013128, partial [Cichlidogyrus casuarinus]
KHPVNVEDAAGWMPIHDAAFNDQYDVVKMLLEHGALVNFVCRDERSTALFEAVHGESFRTATLLVQHGADLWHRNSKGETISQLLSNARLDIAERQKLNELEQLFRAIKERLGDSYERWLHSVPSSVRPRSPSPIHEAQIQIVPDDSPIRRPKRPKSPSPIPVPKRKSAFIELDDLAFTSTQKAPSKVFTSTPERRKSRPPKEPFVIRNESGSQDLVEVTPEKREKAVEKLPILKEVDSNQLPCSINSQLLDIVANQASRLCQTDQVLDLSLRNLKNADLAPVLDRISAQVSLKEVKRVILDRNRFSMTTPQEVNLLQSLNDKCPKLEELSLRFIQLSDSFLTACLKQKLNLFPELNSLDLSYSLGKKSLWMTVRLVVSLWPELAELRMINCRLDEHSESVDLEEVLVKSRLRKLDLSQSWLNLQGKMQLDQVEPLELVMRDTLPSSLKLCLRPRKREEDWSEQLVGQLATCVERNSLKLRELNLSQLDMNFGCSDALMSIFCAAELQALHMEGNQKLLERGNLPWMSLLNSFAGTSLKRLSTDLPKITSREDIGACVEVVSNLAPSLQQIQFFSANHKSELEEQFLNH